MLSLNNIARRMHLNDVQAAVLRGILLDFDAFQGSLPESKRRPASLHAKEPDPAPQASAPVPAFLPEAHVQLSIF